MERLTDEQAIERLLTREAVDLAEFEEIERHGQKVRKDAEPYGEAWAANMANITQLRILESSQGSVSNASWNQVMVIMSAAYDLAKSEGIDVGDPDVPGDFYEGALDGAMRFWNRVKYKFTKEAGALTVARRDEKHETNMDIARMVAAEMDAEDDRQPRLRRPRR